MSDEIPLEPDWNTDSLPESDEIPLEPDPELDTKTKKKLPPGLVGAPLPRLWKAEPEEESDETPVSRKSLKANPTDEKKGVASEPLFASKKVKKAKEAKKGKEAKKKAKGDEDGTGKSVLIEETPELDTFESRQRIRIIVGASAGALVLLFCVMVFKSFIPAQKVEEPIQEDFLAAVNQKASVSHERDESEAKSLMARAREFAKNKKVELAIPLLNTVINKYPSTKSAREAKVVLERPSRNLSLFPDGDIILTDLGKSNSSPPIAPPTQKPEPKMVGTVPAAIPTAPAAPPMPSPVPTAVAVVPPPVPVKPSRPLPVGFHPRPGTEIDPSGWPYEIVGERDDSSLVLILGGIFTQGRDGSEPAESPAHEVKLSTYYMDKNEVTNRQFDLFQKEAGRRSERARALTRDISSSKVGVLTPVVEAKGEFPVTMVTAREAKEYAEWAGKNLPTEAQWEIAGRTSDGRIYPWGPTPPAWSKPRAPKQVDDVMSFPQDVSAYGVFDLSGNVWEWTKDWYDSRYYQQYKNRTAEDPTGLLSPPRVKQLVVKGGDKGWSLTHREGLKAETRLPYLGFRCVLQVEGPGNAFQPKPPAAAPGQPAPSSGGGGDPVPF